jgi:deoxyribonuclease-4
MNKKRKTGFHLSISGGVYKAVIEANREGYDALQIFLKNSSRWEGPPLKEKDIEIFKAEWGKTPSLEIYAHTGYLINIGGEGENLVKSMDLLNDELHRSSLLGVKYLVLHPGNHLGMGVDEGIKRIAANLDRTFEGSSASTEILLETTAGQGTSVGHRFEHIRDIMALSSCSSRLAVCLDTCHIFAAGYDISTPEGYDEMITAFDKIIGIDKLRLIHLNDSKKDMGSHVDRHDHIGKGIIGEKGFELLLTDERIKHVDIVLETPVDDESSNRINMETVKRLGGNR